MLQNAEPSSGHAVLAMRAPHETILRREALIDGKIVKNVVQHAKLDTLTLVFARPNLMAVFVGGDKAAAIPSRLLFPIPRENPLSSSSYTRRPVPLNVLGSRFRMATYVLSALRVFKESCMAGDAGVKEVEATLNPKP